MTGETVAHAERYVIGAILNDARVLREVQEQVSPGDFDDLRIGDIFRGILKLASDSIPVSLVTVADSLEEWDVRGYDISTLASWQQLVTSAVQAPYWARRVREAALLRLMSGVGSKLQAASDPGPAISQAITSLTEIRDRELVGPSSTPTLREVLNVPEKVDAYDWVVPDLLERRDRLMLTGSEGGGKSTLLRQIVVLSAAGVHPFRFAPIDPVRVLVIDVENSERQWRRAVRGMTESAADRGRRDPRDSVALHCASRMDITRASDLGDIHRRIEQTKPDLLMIGPLYRLIPRAINSDDDAAPLLDALDSLREHDVAMLIEAHAGHAVGKTGSRDMRPRGSAALLGWPEFGLGLQPHREQQQRQVFHLGRWRGDRDARQWPKFMVRGHVWPWEPTVLG